MAQSLEELRAAANLEQEQLAHASETFGKIRREKLRALVFAAFRAWCETEANRNASQCRLHDVMRNMRADFERAFGVEMRSDWIDALLSHLQFEEPYALWVEQIWELVRAGLVVPSRPGMSNKGGAGWFVEMRMTPRGRAVFTSGDHPLSPGFIERLRRRCKSLPPAVVDEFQSAVRCMEKDELRAAVGMVGLAYELTIEAIGVALAKKQHFDLTTFEGAAAWRRVDLIKTAIRTMSLTKGELAPLVRALDYAEIIRERRNDGVHTKPRWPFDELSEVENLIVQAGMQLPTLWSIRAKG